MATTTPTAAPTAAPSTEAASPTAPALPQPPVKLGDIVLVRLDANVLRPLIVSSVDRYTPPVATGEAPKPAQWRVSGLICCCPEDHTTPGLRGNLGRDHHDPMRIHGQPGRYQPYAFGEMLQGGRGIGQWVVKGAPK